MAGPKLEFRIVRDVKAKKIQMDNMSVDVSNALLTILRATTRIVELTPNHKDIRICVKEGSAVVSIQGPAVEAVQKQFAQIVERKSSNKKLVEEWRNIQTLFSSNGIQYEASFKVGNTSTSIIDSLKSKRQFRTKRKTRPPVSLNVVFLTGKLIAVGGKNPNIHIDDEENERIVISCTELGANKAKAYLYKQIMISTWCTKTAENDRFELCDSYGENQVGMFEEFRKFVTRFKRTSDEIESLKMLHYKCQEILKDQAYSKYRKFLRLFNTEKQDINVLKTLLIVSRPFAEQENIGLIYYELDQKFKKQFEKLK